MLCGLVLGVEGVVARKHTGAKVEFQHGGVTLRIALALHEQADAQAAALDVGPTSPRPEGGVVERQHTVLEVRKNPVAVLGTAVVDRVNYLVGNVRQVVRDLSPNSRAVLGEELALRSFPLLPALLDQSSHLTALLVNEHWNSIIVA